MPASETIVFCFHGPSKKKVVLEIEIFFFSVCFFHNLYNIYIL